MTRAYYIARFRRQIYGEIPSDDAQITINLVNAWLNDAIAAATKAHHDRNEQIEGMGYVNNSFYLAFTGITLTQATESIDVWQGTLPQIPLSFGKNEGIGSLKIYKSFDQSFDATPLSQSQLTYVDRLPIVNGLKYWNEGNILKVKSEFSLWQFFAKGRIISGGDATDLNSELNVPSDWFPVMDEFLKAQLGFEKAQKLDLNNDGNDQA